MSEELTGIRVEGSFVGRCGRALEVKGWLRGISVSCAFKGEKSISYPNRGVETAIARFCLSCGEEPK